MLYGLVEIVVAVALRFLSTLISRDLSQTGKRTLRAEGRLGSSFKPKLLGTSFEGVRTALGQPVTLVRQEECMCRDSLSFVPHKLVSHAEQRSRAVIT